MTDMTIEITGLRVRVDRRESGLIPQDHPSGFRRQLDDPGDLRYEAANRPDWIAIPFRGITSILDTSVAKQK